MPAIRKASAYSKKIVRPFTRKSRSKNKSYIKTVPFTKITKFEMGNIADFNNGKHKYILRLIAEESVQIRDNALESCRMLLNKQLETQLQGQYYFGIKVYPHHFLRENKTAAGAGADRLSSGMKHSYGIVIGRAAIVPAGKDIMMVSVPDERAAHLVKTFLTTIKSKVPCKTKISFEKVG